MSDKKVRCWGEDAQGALGRGPRVSNDGGGDTDAPDADPPVAEVAGLANVSQVSAGGTTTCARLDDGSVHCWGGNELGQLGLTTDPPTSDSEAHSTPSAVALPGAASRVDVGPSGACALLAADDVVCWGANDQAQLAREGTSAIGGPEKANLRGAKLARVAPSMHTSFAVDDRGRLMSWGAMNGAAGCVSGRAASVTPDPIPELLALDQVTGVAVSSWQSYFPDWSSPEQGLAHACAIARGSVYCWGASLRGALGLGVPFPFVGPTRAGVQGKVYPQRVAVSMESTCLRMTNGTLQCAGDDSFGQLGRGAAAGLFSDVFTPATALTEYALRIALSDQTTCAIVRGGKVWCWGGNASGGLGLGTTDDERHPVPSLVGL